MIKVDLVKEEVVGRLVFTKGGRAALVVALVALAACGGGSGKKRATTTTSTSAAPTTTDAATTPSTATGAAGKAYRHVVWIWMENHSYGQVIGAGAAPYETGLARQFGTATRYQQVGKPSLPNYIGATSGDTQGISDDADPSEHRLPVDNLFRQVRAAGGTEGSFQEGMRSNCALESWDRYAVKHNPAAYYIGGGDRVACQQDNVPFEATLPTGPLPTFAFVTPDLCNDTHDCSVATGDAWLKTFVPPLMASPEYREGSTAIFVIWDEDDFGPVPNIVISPTTPAGTVVSQSFDHYSLLRTTEELLGLPLLARARAATSMRAAFHL
jgi:phospholipase C